MTGLGIARGMWITFCHFVISYVEDLKHFRRGPRPDAQSVHQSASDRGVFTVQYPEERLQVWERFRSFPMLIYDKETGGELCTSCGICAKVCPPQCIWIVRGKGPDGRSRPEPAEFYIDISICMSCGFCSEYCPFDAIKMDHNFELADYERLDTFVFDKKRLMQSSEYYAQTHPVTAAQEEEIRRKKAEAKAAR